MTSILITSALLLTSAGRTPTPRAPAAVPEKPMATSITSPKVNNSTITFTATDPDTNPSVAGSAGATVSWNTTGGATTRTWTLTVNSSSSSFSACSTVPASAVTVSCTSTTGGHSGACGAATTLSTTAAGIASGTEATGTASYSVALSFTLADNWKYIASSSCSLSVSYTITAN